MKNFLSYFLLIIISALIIYFFYPYLIAIAVILLIICFHKEFLGLCALAQIVVVVVGIPYLFFTDSQFRSSILTPALFFGGIFLLGYLSERNEKSKENNETGSSTIKPSQVSHNVRSHYSDTAVRNSSKQ